MRVIRTAMYNAFRMHGLIVSEADLAKSCSWYSYSRKRKEKAEPFRTFISNLAAGIEAVLKENEEVNDEIQVDEEAVNQRVQHGYKRRETLFKRHTDLWKLHRTNREEHECVKNDETRASETNQRTSQFWCVWCCCSKDHETGCPHYRNGHKTTYKCNICDVPLCKEKCFEDFHKSKVLKFKCGRAKTGATSVYKWIHVASRLQLKTAVPLKLAN
jgi:hypothetical protein